MTSGQPLAWPAARAAAHAAGQTAMPEPVAVPLAEADGLTLASSLTTLTDLPAFPTSSVDGYAIRGPGPWRLAGQVLAGTVAPPIADGEAIEIATGAMVPEGARHIIRVEDSTVDPDGRVSGEPRPVADWRQSGDEAAKGEELLPAYIPVTPGVVGLAAACGYDVIPVIPPTRVSVVIFGDELLTSGPPGEGRVRDSLGPQIPGWLRRLGARVVDGFNPRGPVEDTLEAHVAAIRAALDYSDLVCTTGGTMRGPVDHLHPALAELGVRYIADAVAVRPGFPMLLAEVPVENGPTGAGGPTGGGSPTAASAAAAGSPAAAGRARPKFVAGLPGNPQSAIVALVSLVVPLLAGLTGRPEPQLERVTLGEGVAGRGEHTHLALVRVEPSGFAYPLAHSGSAMLRGLARADGFAVIEPGTDGRAGSLVPLVPLPLMSGGRP